MIHPAIITVLVIILIFVLFSSKGNKETMMTKPEKARAISEWFEKDGEKSYVKFRDELEDSNIVEYEDALRLHKRGRLNPSSIILKL